MLLVQCSVHKMPFCWYRRSFFVHPRAGIVHRHRTSTFLPSITLFLLPDLLVHARMLLSCVGTFNVHRTDNLVNGISILFYLFARDVVLVVQQRTPLEVSKKRECGEGGGGWPAVVGCQMLGRAWRG